LYCIMIALSTCIALFTTTKILNKDRLLVGVSAALIAFAAIMTIITSPLLGYETYIVIKQLVSVMMHTATS
jgi:hypothetical protein